MTRFLTILGVAAGASLLTASSASPLSDFTGSQTTGRELRRSGKKHKPKTRHNRAPKHAKGTSKTTTTTNQDSGDYSSGNKNHGYVVGLCSVWLAYRGLSIHPLVVPLTTPFLYFRFSFITQR